MAEKLTKEQEDQIYADRFKKEHGISPDEFKKQQLKTQEEANKAKFQAFCAKLDADRIAPCLKEKYEAFCKTERTEDDIQALILDIIQFAKDDTLIVPEETTIKGKDKKKFNNTPDAEADEKIRAIMKRDKVSYAKANDTYLLELRSEEQEA